MNDVDIIHRSTRVGTDHGSGRVIQPAPDALRDAVRAILDGVVERATLRDALDDTPSETRRLTFGAPDDQAWELSGVPMPDPKGYYYPGRRFIDYPTGAEAETFRLNAMAQDWTSPQASRRCLRFLGLLSGSLRGLTAKGEDEARGLPGWGDVVRLARLFCDTYDATAPSRRRR